MKANTTLWICLCLHSSFKMPNKLTAFLVYYFDLEGEGSPCRVFSVGHHGDVAPLHRQPLGQRQHGDRGVVGATRVKLQYHHVFICYNVEYSNVEPVLCAVKWWGG